MRAFLKKTRFWSLILVIAVITTILYFFFLSPSARSLRATPLQYSADYNPATYSVDETQVVKDLNYPETRATLTLKEGDFYDFGFSPTDESGGGIEVIAYKNAQGKFEKIWGGQDAADCSSVEKYDVPTSISPWCSKKISTGKTILVDRSNFVRYIFSQLVY